MFQSAMYFRSYWKLYIKRLTEKCEINDIVRAMAYKPDVDVIQEEGCVALLELSTKSDYESHNYNNIRTVVTSGGITAVVNAISNHQDNEITIKHALQLVIELSFNADNRKNIADVEGIEAIVKTMKKYKDSPDIIILAINIFNKLARNDMMRKQIGEKDGIYAINNAMCDYPQNHDIQQLGKEVLKNLSSNQKNKIIIAKL